MNDYTYFLVKFENGGFKTHKTTDADNLQFPGNAEVEEFESKEELEKRLDK